MKIAFFTDSYKPNTDGVVSVTEILAKEMAKRGHKVTVVCPGDRTEIIEEDGYKIVKVEFHRIKVYETMGVTLKDPDYLDEYEDFSTYDLIHLQTNFSMAALGFLTALKHNIPLSCTYHTNVADFVSRLMKKEILTFDKKNPIYKVIANKVILGGARRFATNTIWKMTVDFHNAVPSTTSPSEFCKRQLIDKGVKNPITVINNPMNPSLPSKSYGKKYRIGKKFVVLHIGRISGEKRIDILIKAMAKLKKKMPDSIAIIASDGPLRAMMEKLAEELGVKEKILFTGFIPRDELNWLYSKADVLCSFGLDETFNLCATEGLYYGLPLVISNAGPHKEIVKGNGYLIDPDDKEVDNYSKAIYRLYKNKRLRDKMSKKSKELWKKFSYVETIDRHEKYFLNAAKNNKVSNKNFVNFVKYISNYTIAVNILLFSASLRIRKIDKLEKRFNEYRKSLYAKLKQLGKLF